MTVRSNPASLRLHNRHGFGKPKQKGLKWSTKYAALRWERPSIFESWGTLQKLRKSPSCMFQKIDYMYICIYSWFHVQKLFVSKMNPKYALCEPAPRRSCTVARPGNDGANEAPPRFIGRSIYQLLCKCLSLASQCTNPEKSERSKIYGNDQNHTETETTAYDHDATRCIENFSSFFGLTMTRPPAPSIASMLPDSMEAMSCLL